MRIRFEDSVFFFEGYPFAPSVAFDEAPVALSEVVSGDLPTEKGPGWLEHESGELVHIDELNWFRVRRLMTAHEIPLIQRVDVWRLLLLPFQDAVSAAAYSENANDHLVESGFELAEVHSIQNRVRRRMMSYNSTLWARTDLGLYDVLEAHKFTDRRGEFVAFFEWAMAIALRGRPMGA